MVVWCHWESELNDKITYNTLSLTYGSHLTFVTALMTMLRHYQWNVIGVLTTSYEVSLETVAELEKQALVNNVTVNPFIFICDFLLEDLSRDTMIEAHDLDMTHTDYVFLDMATVINLHEEGTPWVRNDSDDPVAREAYNALYTFTYMARTDNVTYSKFTRDVEEKTSQHPFNYTMGANQEVDYYAGFLHDSVILYGLALHDVIESGDDVMNGTAIFETMKNRQFT
ncbi:atrial natriuretic peptide receptor 3-like, partial [Saccoglossus kowalevskii]